jgi:8-oxo-dGTP pyrophosphatase MutT (NUDIX family)
MTVLNRDQRRRLAAALNDLSEDAEYARGVRDLLSLLGITDARQPSGRVAGMLIDVLKAHLADGIEIGLDWENLDAPAPRGVDFLKVIEGARLRNVSAPTPARSVEAAASIIKSSRAGVESYLMQYDAHAGRYQPIGGKREPHEQSLEETLRREFAEELALPEIPGPAVFSVKQIGTWDELTSSATYGIITRYAFTFFHVLKMNLPIPDGPLGDGITRWVTRAEMDSGTAADGRSISPIYLDGLGKEVFDGLAETELLV